MSQFPDNLDTDADLPYISNNITEIGAEAINAIREAIFAIEATLGRNAQGSESSLASRLDAVLNPDGTFKAAALIAAGLIALPITNEMVGDSAAIAESKLDLEHSTQSLYNQIISNDIDIAALQAAINGILANFLAHISGSSFQHDGFQILLDSDYPNSVPPAAAPLTSISLGDAFYELKNEYFDHIDSEKVGAHNAASIALDTSALEVLTSENLQDAIEELEGISGTFLIDHRDDLHANGFSNFANYRDGYGLNRQILPDTRGDTVEVYISTDRRTIEFTGYTIGSYNVNPGDVVVINTPTSAAGRYTIDSIGARSAIGSKPALTSSQLYLAEHIQYDGYAEAAIFSPSSISTLKGNMAPTIHQSDIRVDSIQVARPNAAKILSLGINPRFITSSDTLGIEVGVGPGLSRTIQVDSLDLDRDLATSVPPTIDTVVQRINHVFQNRSDGNAFPAAAYRVGDELLLSHNWSGSDDYYIKVTSTDSTQTGLYVLGMDGYGANIVDTAVYPTQTASFYVNGERLRDVGTILATTANVTAQTFTFPNGENPLELGVRVGHLLHLKSHSQTDSLGTYFITGVNASSVVIHKNSGIPTQNGVEIEIVHDAIPLDELQGSLNQSIIEIYYDSAGAGGYNLRASNDLVTNVTNSVRIIDISDNFISSTETIVVATSGSGLSLSFTGGVERIVSGNFSGRAVLRNESNSSTATLQVDAPVSGTGTITLSINPHSLEEEVVEVCSVWFDGTTTLDYITDRRLFGTTGLDELREDVTQAYVETPIRELRADGIIVGYDVLQANFTDAESIANLGSNIYGIVFRGGTSYIDGVRNVTDTKTVFFPYEQAEYIVYLNGLGSIDYVRNGTDDGYFTIAEVLDGYAGRICPLALVEHSGTGTTPLSTTDLRYFINELDHKLDLVLDTTNRRIGNFATYEAAEQYIQNNPHDQNLKLRVASQDTTAGITTTSGTRGYTLDLSGRIGALAVNSDLQVISSSNRNADDAHMSSLTIGTGASIATFSDVYISGVVSTPSQITDTESVIHFKSVRFANSVTVNSLGSVVFEDCVFESSASLTLTTIHCLIDNCTFLTDGITVTNNGVMKIRGCLFAPDGSFGAFGGAVDTLTTFEDCTFDGYNGGTGIELTSYAKIINSNFTAITYDNITPGVIISATSTDVQVIGCTFDDNIVFNSIDLVSESDNSEITFNACNFRSTSPSPLQLQATKIINCYFDEGSATLYRDAQVIGNYGITNLQLDSSISADKVAISNNVFGTPDTDTSITAPLTSGTVGRLQISDNHISGNILLGVGATNTQIVNNKLTGELGIQFGTLTSATSNVFVSNNIFANSSTYLVFTNTIGSIFINGNSFSGATNPSTIKFSGKSLFANNKSTTTLTFSAATDSIIDSNLFGSTLGISGATSGSIFSNNEVVGNLSITASAVLTDCQITGNTIATNLIAGASSSMVRTVVDRNIIKTGTTFNSSCTWLDSKFCNNMLGSTSSTTFNSHVDGGNDFSHNHFGAEVLFGPSATLIPNNSVLGNRGDTISVSCQTEGWDLSHNTVSNITYNSAVLDNCTIIANKCTNFTATAEIYSSIIRDNIVTSSMTVTCSSGTTSAVIAGNTAGTMDVSDAMNGTRISGNTITDTMTLQPVDGTVGLIVSDNNIVADLIVFEISGTRTLIDSKFTNNYVDGNITFQTSSGTNTLDDVTIAGNTCDDLTLCEAMTGVHISTNNVRNMDLSACTSIVRIKVTDNIVSSALTLPIETVFGNSTQQSTFLCNYAGEWISTGIGIGTTGDERIFPWGNTQGANSTLISFGGVTAKDVGTANNVDTTTTTGIEC